MNKLLTPLLILTIVGLFGLVFYVKKDAQTQAKDYVKETMEKVEAKLKADKALQEGNNILWELAIETALNKPDQKQFVASAKGLVNPEGEGIKIEVEKAGDSWRVYHPKAGMNVFFTKSGRFDGINVDEMLGKSE